MKIQTTIYAHVSKESNADTWVKLGQSPETEARKFFLYACCEVALGVLVDTDTGVVEILSCDGKGLAQDPKP